MDDARMLQQLLYTLFTLVYSVNVADIYVTATTKSRYQDQQICKDKPKAK